mmetsp:Transcript_14463/g.43063  ORF Transcript_14463/g.43063 Transcript_14463/m.43063 type:complete len:193 (+) Transcript_14463:1078-1656(+)
MTGGGGLRLELAERHMTALWASPLTPHIRAELWTSTRDEASPAHAHTRRIVDEHEASRRLGLTFPVLVRHPDKHPVFQSHPRAVITSSSLPSLSPLRKLDIRSAALRSCWPRHPRSGQRWLRSPVILTATSLYLCAGLSLSLVRDATRLRCQQVACAPSAHAHVILELRRVATTEHPTCNHRFRRRAEVDLR